MKLKEILNPNVDYTTEDLKNIKKLFKQMEIAQEKNNVMWAYMINKQLYPYFLKVGWEIETPGLGMFGDPIQTR